MARVEPVPGERAAVVEPGGDRTPTGERMLVVADYHAGLESWLAHEAGVHLDGGPGERRERLFELVERTDPDRITFLGDLAHFFGGPHGAERGEIEVLFERLSVPAVVVKGNHDGGIEAIAGEGVTVTDPAGVRDGDVGFVHGHTWPDPAVLGADVVCVGHEHPQVAIEDEVGGRRVEPVWLRGPLARDPFAERGDDGEWGDPELVGFPAFNDRVGGTWVNRQGDFLAPFLPEALPAADAYLLDGTRLGDYRSV